MKRNDDLEATIVRKFSVMAPMLDERARRLWAAAESVTIGYGGDALVSAATGLARETIRKGRGELAQGVEVTGHIRRAGAGLDSTKVDDDGTASVPRGDGAADHCRCRRQQWAWPCIAIRSMVTGTLNYGHVQGDA